ncbi:hypothetical protein BG015_010036 [Linnemannia schmuckeri]|uniref:DH domain-containing protein n=1 Tax=Linnemannia schmuckeri TaxID=64567 RepID=A0A9P5S8Y2_9FUNG|nr:hypothetical protein BG015_010036 [Linnemannia schmuckeri]
MPHHTSQQPFFLATLPSSTSTPATLSRKQSFGSVYSSNASSASIISSVGTTGSITSHNGGIGSQSFYNLSKDSNKSNLDLPLPPRHSPYPVLYSHANYSNLSISQHNTSGHSIYSSNSNASSCLSLASSQYSVSVDKVHHAFGSLPPPCLPPPASIFSASSSSLPLAASVNIPINTPAPTATKSLASSSSASLSSRHRTTPKLPYQQQQQQGSKVFPTPSHHASLSRSSSSTDLSLPHTPSLPPRAPSPSPRTLQLPSAAAIGVLPPRKRIPNTIPPLNTKSLVQPATLSPSFLSSRSTNMSSTSPSCESPASGNTYSDASSAAGSTPSTPTHSRPFVAMAITELVISETHYLTAVNRIGNALSQAAEANSAAGHKESFTLRSVSDRWSELTRIQTKFHDDVVAVNEDLRETAGLLNDLLVTLEPILIDHSRDLAISLKKLIRRDQNSEHTAAEWESALRQPLDHLSSYEEWLLRIDPQHKFCKNYNDHLQRLIYKTKMVSDVNQQPRNMLRRLSTMARDVIKRRSSVQLLTQGGFHSEATTPTTPTTPHSASTLDSRYSEKSDACSPITPNPLPMMPDHTVKALGVADKHNDMTIDTVTQPASTTAPETKSPLEKSLPKIPSDTSSHLHSQPSSPQEPATPIADTFLALPYVKQLHHCPSSTSELSGTGTLTTPSSDSLVSSSTSIYSKTSSSSAETIIQVQIQEQLHLRSNISNTTLTRQKFLDDKEARKATLRVGTSEIIQARAQSLQSPSYNSRASAESLRRVSPTKSEAEKPPVKSLISFWEQVNDPLDV